MWLPWDHSVRAGAGPQAFCSLTSLGLPQKDGLHLYGGNRQTPKAVLTPGLLPCGREWVLWVGSGPEKG